jgi:glycosyltransferase involved in cell wall biosynthesis
MESRVSRTLRLTGRWGDGGIHQSDRAVRAGIEASNAQVVREEAAAFEPDLILLGNLDLLGVRLVHEAILDGHPVLHAVANKEPGYSPAEQPRSPRYWIAPCSEWNGTVLREAGYAPARIATVYPGARLDNFYRAFPADSRTLRIAYASIVAPYKGTHVLVDALARLHALGVPFTAEIAGEALDTAFAGRLREFCARSGMASKVSFPGFLDRGALAALFARSNVLSFPSQFPEPFGISQVEAMASGLVVVTSGTGGAAEVVRDGEDGLVHRAEDAAALAVRLRSLASDPALFQRLQAAGQRRALSFSVDVSVRRFEDLAEEMIRSAAAPARARAPAARPAPEQAFAMVPAVAAMT